MMTRFLMLLVLSLVCAPVMAQSWTGLARVVDGDTLWVDGKKFRLFGVDAPESNQMCGSGDSQWPCGQLATQTMRDLVSGAVVTCQSKGQQSYDRIVASCSTRNHWDLGEAMVNQGYAEAATAFTSIYVSMQNRAKAERLGIWKDDDFQSPYEYRQQSKASSNRLSAIEDVVVNNNGGRHSSAIGLIVGGVMGFMGQARNAVSESRRSQASIHDSPNYDSITGMRPRGYSEEGEGRSAPASTDWNRLLGGQKLVYDGKCSFLDMTGGFCK